MPPSKSVDPSLRTDFTDLQVLCEHWLLITAGNGVQSQILDKDTLPLKKKKKDKKNYAELCFAQMFLDRNFCTKMMFAISGYKKKTYTSTQFKDIFYCFLVVNFSS